MNPHLGPANVASTSRIHCGTHGPRDMGHHEKTLNNACRLFKKVRWVPLIMGSVGTHMLGPTCGSHWSMLGPKCGTHIAGSHGSHDGVHLWDLLLGPSSTSLTCAVTCPGIGTNRKKTVLDRRHGRPNGRDIAGDLVWWGPQTVGPTFGTHVAVSRGSNVGPTCETHVSGSHMCDIP